MPLEKNQIIMTEKPSFEAMLDSTCELLEEKHIKYSIRRLREMDEVLAGMEKELDDFLGGV